MRFTKQEVSDDPWGLAIPSVKIETLNATGIMTRKKMLEKRTIPYNSSLNVYTDASPAFLWLTIPKNDRFAQIETAKARVRLHLKATELGLGFHPRNQRFRSVLQCQDTMK